MIGVNVNIPALSGVRNLSIINRSLNRSLERLSTGLAINRGSDNPAGLIASESLRSQLRSLDAASRNIDRASQVISVADQGMAEVTNLLVDLRGLSVQAANTGGLSSTERDAIQLQADSILQSIDRISGSTSFADMSLLDGSQSFRISGVSGDFADVDVFGGSIAPGETANVDVQVTQAAQHAALLLSFGGATVDLGGSSGGTLTVAVAGAVGDAQVTFASGDSVSAVADAINAQADATGVSATVSGGAVVARSRDLGGDAFVSVQVTDAANVAGAGAGVFGFDPSDPSMVAPTMLVDFAAVNAATRDDGVDVAGTIDGAQAAGAGATLSLNSPFLSIDIELSDVAATSAGAKPGFTVTGGPVFQISGDIAGGRVGIGFPNISTNNLGKFSDKGARFSLADVASGGALSLRNGDIAGASKAITGALSDVLSSRGRLGAFQKNTLNASSRQIGAVFVNTTAAESQIRDTDFAFQTAQLSRDQILFAATIQSIGVANNKPASALSLLG